MATTYQVGGPGGPYIDVPPGYQLCVRCMQIVRPRDTVGQWGCRTHPTGATAGEVPWTMLRCCGLRHGLSAHLARTASLIYPVSMETALGCVRIDHGLTVEEATTTPGVVRAHQPEYARVDSRAVILRLDGGVAQLDAEWDACSAKYPRLLGEISLDEMKAALAAATLANLREAEFYTWVALAQRVLSPRLRRTNPLLEWVYAAKYTMWTQIVATLEQLHPGTIVALAAEWLAAGEAGFTLDRVARLLERLPSDRMREDYVQLLREQMKASAMDTEIAPVVLVARMASEAEPAAVRENASIAAAAGLLPLTNGERVVGPDWQ